MKALIPYYGGKQRIVHKLLQRIPEHKTYCEPFAGAASLFWAKPQRECAAQEEYRECLNDLWSELINFYRIVQNRDTFEGFLGILKHIPYSRALYNEYYPMDSDDPIMRAVETYYIIQNSFGSMCSRGAWGFGIIGSNHPREFVNNMQKLIGNKDEILARLSHVYLDDIDAIVCLQRWDSPQAFFYVDPPYFDTAQSYRHQYTTETYAELCERLSCIEGKFMLSSYSNALADDYGWYKDKFLVSTTAVNGRDRIAKNSARIECVYTNYQCDRQMTIEDI